MIYFIDKIIEYDVALWICHAIWALFAWSYLLFYLYDKKHHYVGKRTHKGIRIAPYTLSAGVVIVAVFHYLDFMGLWVMTESRSYYLAMDWIGLLFMFLGLKLVISARLDLNGFWGPHIYKYDKGVEPLLIKENTYENLRHPIYSGQLSLAFGTVLIMNNWLVLGYSLLLLVALFSRMEREEAHLIKAFKDDYPGYKAKSYRIIKHIY